MFVTVLSLHHHCLISPTFTLCSISRSRCYSSSPSSTTSTSTISASSRGEDPSPSTSFPLIRSEKRVILVRHGQSTWNEEGRIQGSSDHSILTPKGESQAESSRQMLVQDSFDVCFSSPLARSKRTAEIIWGSRVKDKKLMPIIQDEELREIDLYSFQGLLKRSPREPKFDRLYRMWQRDAPNFIIDGHYPARELWERARGCWNTILEHHGSESVLVVAHNAINQALIATALGLSSKYFRVLLQSNCGATVLDFTPASNERRFSSVCLNRLNQTPNSPVSFGNSSELRTTDRIILVTQGATDTSGQSMFSNFGYEPMNMLGVIQSQKTAELLLDLKLDVIICSPRVASIDTATAISEVQEAADCLGAGFVPRSVELKQMIDLEVEHIFQGQTNEASGSFKSTGLLNGLSDKATTDIWNRSKKVWSSLMLEFSDDSEFGKNIAIIGHPAVHIGLLSHCLKLNMKQMGSFHLDPGSICVLEFPDGPSGRSIVRCINYTAHLGRWSIPVTRSLPKDGEI